MGPQLPGVFAGAGVRRGFAFAFFRAGVATRVGAGGPAENVGTTVGTGVGSAIDSVVVTLPAGTGSVTPGGGPGEKRPPDMGDGG